MLVVEISGTSIVLHNPFMLALSLLVVAPLLLWRRARRVYGALSARLGSLGSPPRPPYLLILAILLLSLAASTPTIRYYKTVSLESASINTIRKIPVSLVICLDVSKSMNYRDQGLKRIDLAKSFIEKLVKSIGNARVVILVFSHRVRLVYEGSPSNATGVLAGIEAGEKYSAIGDAAVTGASYVEASGLPGVVVVVTDGGWNYGADPVQVARKLRARHVPTVFIIVGHDPRGARLSDRLRHEGVKTYYLNEISYKVLNDLVEEVSRSARLEALRLAGINGIRLPIGERDVSWIAGLLAVIVLASRLALEV